jgi:hypothetical protein
MVKEKISMKKIIIGNLKMSAQGLSPRLISLGMRSASGGNFLTLKLCAS